MKINKSEATLYFFTGSYPYGGVETFIENEIKYLSLAFNSVVIIPTTKENTIRDVPQNVIIDDSLTFLFKRKSRKIKSIFTTSFLLALFYHRKFLFSINALKRINSFISDSLIVFKWLKNNEIKDKSVIYTYWLNGKTYGAIKYKLKYNKSIVVSRAHRYDLYDYWFLPAFWPYRQRTLNDIDSLFVISDDGFKFLKEKYKTGNNIRISRLGITDRKILGAYSKGNTLKIVSVANLNKVKRIPILLRHLNQISINNPELTIHWTHFGDGPEMKILKELLLDVKTKNFLPVLKGRVSNKEVYEYYGNETVDIFINVSESEGVPVSIMEAQSFGKFVIATDVGGTKELITKDAGYLLTKDFKFDDFNKAITYFIENRKTIKAGAIDIRNLCIQSYNAEINYKKFTKELKGLLNE